MTSTDKHATLDDMRRMSDVELAQLRTAVNWRIGTIDGQLLDPDFDRGERPDEWERKARAALNYARREGGAVKNVMAERLAERREQCVETSLLEVLQALTTEHNAVGQILDDRDNARSWEYLERVHQTLDALDVQRWVL